MVRDREERSQARGGQRGLPATALGVGEVKRGAGLLAAAFGERSGVHTGEPDLIDQADDQLLGIVVVARYGTARRFSGGRSGRLSSSRRR